MTQKMKARSADDARASEDVRDYQQNTSVNTGNPSFSQPITGYVHDKNLLVVAVYRGGVNHG